MKNKIAMYRREGRMALKHMWFVVLVFAVVQVIVSIAVAAANSNDSTNGLKSASFAAIWSMFLVIGFTAMGARIVFYGRVSEIAVGFLIGVAAMLTELFFVLMVTFFIFGQGATNNNSSTAPSDKAYAVFSLLNMIIYFVWAIILVVHRQTVVIQGDEVGSKEFAAYDGTQGETYNPAINAAAGDDFQGDQEVL